LVRASVELVVVGEDLDLLLELLDLFSHLSGGEFLIDLGVGFDLLHDVLAAMAVLRQEAEQRVLLRGQELVVV